MKTSTSIHLNNRTVEQSNNSSSRRGSALLVVLGMLSFMIVSAVAFSAWMRSSRLPNSFLRKASSSRMLAKAALSAAIDEIDVAIGDNPHPGFGGVNVSFREDGRVRGTGRSANRNLWLGRVYIGQKEVLESDGEKTYTTSDNARDHLISPTKTVSTLTLEGLAHIPPPFVSEARYYSRRSNAATWHDLAFDAGRYAFCAIDVSDCLDVNRLAASIGRSTSPYGRISLAYLFEDDNHKGYKTDPKKWDDFMQENFRTKSLAEVEVSNGEASGKDIQGSSVVPVTSMADLNLAMFDAGAGIGLESPFSKYVDQSGSSFFGGIMPTSTEGKRIRGMAFVSDSWLPQNENVKTSGEFDQPQLDLADEANQPFPSGELNKDNKVTVMAPAEKFKGGKTTVGDRLYDRLGGIGMALLHDYLDEDNVPISLALPQVERAPMIAAITHNFDASAIQIVMTDEPKGADGLVANDNYPNIIAGGKKDDTSRTIRKVCTYRLNASKFVQGIDGGFKATVVYPFHHGRDVSDPDTFTIEAHADFFLASEPMALRTGNREDVFHAGEMGSEAEFANSVKLYSGVFRVPYTAQSCTFSEVTDEQSAMRDIPFVNASAGSQIASQLNAAGNFMEVVWDGVQTRSIDPETKQASAWSAPKWTRTSAVCGLTPVTANGTLDERFADAKQFRTYLDGNSHDVQARVCAAIWIRIKNKDGRTVDMVPGSLVDDKNYNSINNLGAMEEQGNAICGRPGPLMLFQGASFTFGDTEYDSGGTETPFALAPKGVICSDPRWNWAPEHWWIDNGASAATWLQNCQVGQGGRDRDIFMMTGDARYLQSVYELACLPRLTTLENYGTDRLRGNMEQLGAANMSAFPAQFEDTFNRHLMWMTYNPYYRRGVAGFDEHPTINDARRDPFEFLNIVNRGNGFRLCPFSDSVNVIEAAIANTPTDWWAAGLDPTGQAGIDDTTRQNAKTFNQKHAFNEMNSTAAFAWKDVERISQNIISAIGSITNGVKTVAIDDGIDQVWQDAFDEVIDWSGDLMNSGGHSDYFAVLTKGQTGNSNDQLDGNTDELYDVDRKFLYGYWRECFAAKQQLFLVFVRAEPMMMGGGAVGAVPPQLASRAVALVWRDPNPAVGHENDIKYPHRTRVLYYRQLD